MKRSLICLFCLLFVLTACGGKASSPKTPFDYDSSVPFDIKVISETEQDGVTVQEISYAAHDPNFSVNTGGRTVAYLVRPHGKGPFAGVVYLHWLGPVSSTKKEYLAEAVALAQHGAVCLLPQGYFPWSSLPTGSETDRALMIGQVIELRRAFDFLVAQPGVDSKRLGFVGHDYGAVYGGVLAGVDKRARTYVLIAGAPSFDSWIGLFGSIDPKQYLAYVEDIDPVNFVPQAAPASLFFQFGKRDAVVPESLANQYYAAASQPKKIGWYDDLHDMHSDAVRQDHQAWLIDQLGLNP
jgi:dienelactone hydrolase